MHTYTVLIGFLICLVMVNARHYTERSDTENVSDDRDQHTDYARKGRERSTSRHRRRSWHNNMNYGYEYPQPPNPFYPDNRRDYDQNQQDLLPQIFRLLDEISAYVKRPPPPPPPPQPIYIPYPVAYPVPQACNCPTRRVTQKPNVTSRFPEMEDTNQNWGFVTTNEDDNDDESDGSRPISFDPVMPKRPTKRPVPPLDHGSSQAANNLGSLPSSSSSARVPGMCDVLSLSCCNNTPQKQKQCFTDSGCAMTYDNGKGCEEAKLLAIIEAYSKAYSPVAN